jgi:hypothetical protein
MDNQHRKIAGYRELSQADIDMMNTIKSMGPQMEELLAKVGEHLAQCRQPALTEADALADLEGRPRPDFNMTRARIDRAQPERWAAIARTHFQEGLMALTRAVAQPTFF